MTTSARWEPSGLSSPSAYDCLISEALPAAVWASRSDALSPSLCVWAPACIPGVLPEARPDHTVCGSSGGECCRHAATATTHSDRDHPGHPRELRAWPHMHPDRSRPPDLAPVARDRLTGAPFQLTGARIDASPGLPFV